MSAWTWNFRDLGGNFRRALRPTVRRAGRGRTLAAERLEGRVLLAADLALTKTDAPDPVLPGEVLDYFITVENIGDEATQADFVDELPPEVIFISATSSQGDLSESDGIVSGPLGTIEPGETVTIAITVTAREDDVTLLNTATVSSPDDAELSNNSDTATTRVLDAPDDAVDLVVKKKDSPNVVVPGEAVTYTITVDNRDHRDVAQDVVLFDRLPDDVILISATSSQGSVTVTDGLVIAELGTLGARDFATVEIVVMPTEPGILVNTAVATSSSGIEQHGRGDGHSDGDSDGHSDGDSDGHSDGDSDGDSDGLQDGDSDGLRDGGADNVDRAFTRVRDVPADAPDLAVVKTDDPDTVLPGEALSYTITVENLSSENEARRVLVRDLLPADTIFISAVSSQGIVRELNGVIVADLGTLDPGDVATVSIVVTPTADGLLRNVALATTASGDTDVFNNLEAETTEVLAAPATAADLRVVKGDSPDPAERGEELVYTIAVTNRSDDNPAFDVVLTDRLPAGAALLSLDTSQGTVTEADGIVVADIGTLDPGETAIVEIVVLPGRRILRNTAVATTSSGDVDVLDNVDETLTLVRGFDHECFVEHAFGELFGRDPDDRGLSFWAHSLDTGLERAEVARALAHSDEFFATVVRPAYERFLDRQADDEGLAFWVGRMRDGLSEERLQAGFVGSAEFFARSGGSNRSWVAAMYRELLGRDPDDQGETFWVERLESGAHPVDVAFGFTGSQERLEQRVEDHYFRFLDRSASDDEVGFWVSAFERGASHSDVVAGFIGSDEFFENCRFGESDGASDGHTDGDVDDRRRGGSDGDSDGHGDGGIGNRGRGGSDGGTDGGSD